MDIDQEQAEAHRQKNSMCYGIKLINYFTSNLEENCEVLPSNGHNHPLTILTIFLNTDCSRLNLGKRYKKEGMYETSTHCNTF